MIPSKKILGCVVGFGMVLATGSSGWAGTSIRFGLPGNAQIQATACAAGQICHQIPICQRNLNPCPAAFRGTLVLKADPSLQRQTASAGGGQDVNDRSEVYEQEDAAETEKYDRRAREAGWDMDEWRQHSSKYKGSRIADAFVRYLAEMLNNKRKN